MQLPKPLWPIGLALFCSVLGALGQGFFKRASEKLVLTDPISWITNGTLILGLGFYALATILFVVALKFGNLSTVYPVIAMSYIWVMLIAVIHFQEKVSLLNWFGIALIIVGVTLAAGVRTT